MRARYKQIACIMLSLGVSLMSPYILAADNAGTVDEQQSQDKVYKSVGPGGETVYTDKPTPGSEEIKVPSGTTYKPIEPPAGFKPYKAPPKKSAKQTDENTIEVTSPQNGATIWSGTGELSVAVSLGKKLARDQRLQYEIDGTTVLTGTQTSHTFQNIFRGEHTLTVRLIGPAGTAASAPVTFYMRRPTVKH